MAADERGGHEARKAARSRDPRPAIERNILSLERRAGPRGARLAPSCSGRPRRAEDEFRTARRASNPTCPTRTSGWPRSRCCARGRSSSRASVDASFDGLTAFLATGRGSRNVRDLLTLGTLCAAFASAWAIALALLLRHGGLLLHDLEESLGPAHHRSASLALFLLLLLLPVAHLPGLGLAAAVVAGPALRLPARLGSACSPALLALGTLAIGPGAALLEERLRTTQNPLYRAALAAIEGGPDAARDREPRGGAAAAIRTTATSCTCWPAQYKKAGRYDDAAALYREALAADPQDAVALNNLANLEFGGGEFQAAIARYKQGSSSDAADASRPPLLQPVARPPAAVRVPARPGGALAGRPPRAAARRRLRRAWKYDKGDYAVVDLGLSARRGVGEVRGRASGRRARRTCAAARRAARPGCAAGIAAPTASWPRSACSRSPSSWSRAGAGARCSPCAAEVRHAVLPALPPRRR